MHTNCVERASAKILTLVSSLPSVITTQVVDVLYILFTYFTFLQLGDWRDETKVLGLQDNGKCIFIEREFRA